jgi:hypothetical protein
MRHVGITPTILRGLSSVVVLTDNVNSNRVDFAGFDRATKTGQRKVMQKFD